MLGRSRPDPRLHHALEHQPDTLRLDLAAEEILAKVQLVQAKIKQLDDNHAK
jgi:hypothetical protein